MTLVICLSFGNFFDGKKCMKALLLKNFTTMFTATQLFSSVILSDNMNLMAYSYHRLHAQALTLAALAGAAAVEYYDHKSGARADRYAKLLDMDAPAQKD